jgi:hypothetical protein
MDLILLNLPPSRQFTMSSQADWNHLVVDLRNNIFKLFSFAFDCSKLVSAGEVFSANPDVSSSDSDCSLRKKKPNCKNVKRLAPSARQLRSSRLQPSVCKPRQSRRRPGAKRKKLSISSSPSTPEAAAVVAAANTDDVIEDAKFQNVF